VIVHEIEKVLMGLVAIGYGFNRYSICCNQNTGVKALLTEKKKLSQTQS